MRPYPFSSDLCSRLSVSFPLIMAPMFLVSNESMLKAAISEGIVGVFPALNFRKQAELNAILKELNRFRSDKPGTFGVNLIVQRSNPFLSDQLNACAEHSVPFIITSLGDPHEVIRRAETWNGLVYCDVTNLKHAAKAAEAGAHGFIAVGAGAGGHAGSLPLHVLIPALKDAFPAIPVVASGGLGSGRGLFAMAMLGAEGFSLGTRFIASTESPVSKEYKDALIAAGISDIVMTERLSGTPCNVVDTPDVRKMGLKLNRLERYLSINKRTKKQFKMLLQWIGMRKTAEAILPNAYSKIWSAGQSVQFIHEVKSCREIISEMRNEFDSLVKA